MKIKQLLILSAAALSLAACGEHTHSFGDAWKSDDTSHWHECECGEKSDKADHLDTNTDGKCDVCNHDMEVPSPTGTQVTQAEWEAAFGLEKPYYIADNYKAIMRLIMEDETLYPSLYSALQVDGLKAKLTNKEVCTHEEEQFYVKVNNVYNAYLYGQKSEKKWDLFENAPNPARNFANFLEPIFGTYSSFAYNQNDSTYKCVSLDYEGTILTNVNIKFIDKKIVSCSFDSLWGIGEGRSTPFHWTFEITYGGQTVTLPEIDPEPSGEEYKVTENQFNAAFSLEGLRNVTITTSSGSYSQICEADGNKEFNENLKPYDFYLSLEDGIMYEYKQEDSEWVKNQCEGTTFAREDMIRMFGNVYNQLTFDEDSNSYKGTNISVEGAVRYSEVEYCFENLKVVAIHAVGATGSAAGQSMTVTLTKYGQTIVNLPKIDPEPAQGMTEDEFNALVNKAYTKGFYFKTSAPQADCISSTVIFDCVNKNLYISENWKDEDFIGITVYFDSVVYFKSPMTGEWQEPRQLSSKELETQFNAGLAEYLMQILPTTDFSDFTFNPDDGTYEVTINLSPYEGVEITMVYVYVMDANGITSISGTTTYVYGGETQISTVSIYDVDIGEQEISAPF